MSKSTLLSTMRAAPTARIVSDPYVGPQIVCAAMGGINISTLYRTMKRDPKFPRPVRITANRIAWRSSAIEAYLASRPVAHEIKKGSAR